MNRKVSPPFFTPGQIAWPKSCGAALVMVLVSLLALSVVVLDVSQRITRQSMEASLLLLEYSSALLAGNALDIGLDMLGSMQDEPFEQGTNNWSRTWQQGRLSIKITPCASRLNLNLAGLQEQQAERMKNALSIILARVSLKADDLASLRYWSGVPVPEKRLFISKEIPHFYALENREYKAPQRALTRPEELLLVPGFEGLDPGWIRQHFTVWGEQAGIDINSADKEIVLALLPELEPYWDRLDSSRQKRNIAHPNELIKNAGLDIATYHAVLPYIILNPEVFEIIIEVREGSWYEQHRYIVQRDMIDPASPPKVLVRDVLETKPL